MLGTKHGVGNCIVFDHLIDYYPEGVTLFKEMVAKYKIEIPQGICKDCTEKEIDIMIEIALSLVPLWENALGEEWESIMTPEKLRGMYLKM